MVTSWSRTLAGPGTSATRLAARIGELSQGQIVVDVFAAGEIVPAFAVHEAVANGTVDCGHTAAFFLAARKPEAAFFTTVPFGMGPLEHQAWIEAGDGQALWDEVYRDVGLRGLMAGNTGPSLAGWFRREIRSFEDMNGLRIRVQGLGGEVYRRLGAIPQSIPPGDVYTSLERGTIDAAELLGPMNDLPLGLHRIAPHTFYPAFNKPNGASEFVVSLGVWEALTPALRQAVRMACALEHAAALAEATQAHALALRRLVSEGARPAPAPADLLREARKHAAAVMADLAASSPLAGRVQASYQRSMEQMAPWGALSASPRP
jgi:TRAP-type mannitol/chloroaromatic compound transport system substrate-binding protein